MKKPSWIDKYVHDFTAVWLVIGIGTMVAASAYAYWLAEVIRYVYITITG